MSRTRKWSCRVTAVAELLTGGGGGGGGEARPAAPRGYCRGSSRQLHGATPVSVLPRVSRRLSFHPPIRPTGPGRPSLHHLPGFWGRRPARSHRRPWPRPAPGPLARRHHDGGDRPVPGAHRALGDAAAGEGAGGGQAGAGRGAAGGEGRN